MVGENNNYLYSASLMLVSENKNAPSDSDHTQGLMQKGMLGEEFRDFRHKKHNTGLQKPL